MSETGEARTAPTGASAPRVDRAGRRVALVALAVLVAVAVVGVVTVPSGSPVPRADTGLSPVPDDQAAVGLLLTVDAVEAASGTASVRLQPAADATLPAEGATVFTSIGSLPSLVVKPGVVDKEQTATVPLDSGQITNYPFDRYTLTVEVTVRQGANPSLVGLDQRRALPVSIEGRNAADTFNASATSRTEDGVARVVITLWRTPVSRAWVVAMMAIMWALALGVAVVTVLIVRRRRAWESRHLAWLGAMMFALITFRNAAPGSPPIGTWFDAVAWFEALAIVAICLVVLVVDYALGPRQRLGL